MLSALAALALGLGYLLGSLPSAALLSRWRGENVFAVGSGNMGAMNTARNIGYGMGALVLVVDVAKGALASSLGIALGVSAGVDEQGRWVIALAAGFGAVLGHAYSLYVGFRGGKGLATTLGISLPLYPLAGLYGTGLLVVLTLVLRRRSNLAAMLTIALYPGLVVWTLKTANVAAAIVVAALVGVTAVAVIVLIKHIAALRGRGGKASA